VADNERIGLEAVLQDANFQAGLKRYLDGVSRMERETGGAASSISRQFVGLGNTVWGVAGRVAQAAAVGFGAITVAAGAAGVTSLKTAADFQQSQNIFQATSGATNEQMATMSRLSKELGADMQLPATSAVDAGRAMTELAKAGLSIDDVFGAARGTLQLAAAGTLTEARAAEISANALNAFGLSGSQATMVADLLAGAANASSAEVDDMAMSLQMTAAVANQSNVSINDTVTALGLMANAGIKGSDAGTSLKTMLLRLQAPTDTAAETMKSLGINVYDAQGKMLPFTNIIDQFNKAMYTTADVTTIVGGRTKEQEAELKRLSSALKTAEASIRDYESGVKGANQTEQQRGKAMSELYAKSGILREQIDGLNGIQGKAVKTTRTLTEAQRNAALETIFGTDAIRAATILTRSGVAGFDKMSKAVNRSGAAAELTAARTKGLGGAWLGVKSQIETAMLAFGEPLLGPLENIMRRVAEVIGSPAVMAGLEKFGAVFGAGIASVFERIGAMMEAFQTGGAGGLMAALGLSPDAMAFIENVSGELAAFGTFVTGTLVPALVELGERAMPIVNQALGFLNEHWDEFKAALTGVGAVLAGAAIVAAIAAIGGAIAAIGAPILALVAAAGVLAAAWEGDWGGIRTTLTNVWINTLQPALKSLWEWLKINVPAAIKTLSDFWSNTLQPALKGIWDFIANKLIPALRDLPANISSAVESFKQWVGNLLDSITSFFPNLIQTWTDNWEMLKTIIGQVWENIMTAVATGIDNLLTTIGITSAVRDRWAAIWEDIKLIVGTIWQRIVEAVTVKVQEIYDTVATKIEEVRAWWGETWDAFYTKLSEVWASFMTPIVEKAQEIYTAITTKLVELYDAWSAKWTEFSTKLGEVWAAFLSAITTKAQEIYNTVTGKIGEIVTWITSQWQRFYDIGAALLQGLINGALSKAGELIETLTGTVENVIAKIKEALGIASPSEVMSGVGAEMMAGIGAGFSGNAAPMLEIFNSIMNQLLASAQAVATTLINDAGAAFTLLSNMLRNDLLVWLGASERGLIGLLMEVAHLSGQSMGWAEKFEAAFYVMRRVIAEAASVADGLLGALEGIKAIGTIENKIITYHQAVYLPDITPGGGGDGGGGGAQGRQHGGPAGAATSYLVGERGPELFMSSVAGRIFSNDMLRGMTGAMRQSFAGMGTTNIYNNRTAQIQMSPQYRNVQSEASVYYDLSAALMAAGM